MIIEISYSVDDEEELEHEGYYSSIEEAKEALDSLSKRLSKDN